MRIGRYIMGLDANKLDPDKSWYEVRDTVRRNAKDQPRLVCKYRDFATAKRKMAVLERKNGSG